MIGHVLGGVDPSGAVLAFVAGVSPIAALWWLWASRHRELVARAGHEVRGPLAAAQLALHGAARRGEVAPAMVAALELELRRAALALEDLHGGPSDRPADVDLLELLDCQVRTWDEVARARGAEIALCAGPGAAVVHADALRVAQAVGNVVANAIEHGGGRIEVRTRTVGGRVRIEVHDGGSGLPAPVAELARGRRGGRGARGRGLAIASGIAHRAGGRLVAAPSARGACVALELPAAGGPTSSAPVGARS